MGSIIDISGQRFGRLTVLSIFGRTPDRHVTWRCTCDCGKEVVVSRNRLRSGNTQSCGCLQRELSASRKRTHGQSARINGHEAKEYRVWCGMIQRCTNRNVKCWRDYGGRGVIVCERWLNSFEAFLEDMGRAPSVAHTLERQDNNGNYEPSNCVWATRRQQSRNTRRSHFLTHDGITLCVRDWAARLGIHHMMIHKRLKKGRSISDIVAEFSTQPDGTPEAYQL